MTFLKKALGAFVEFDEKGAMPALQPSHGAAPPRENFKYQPPAATHTMLPAADVEKFAAHFDELFEKTNLPGPDYYEFSKAVEAMEADIPEERSRMKAAFVALKVQGMTKEQLLATARQYIDVVEADRAQVKKAADDKARDEIAPLKEQHRQAVQAVDEDERLIAELQAGLAAKQKHAEDLLATVWAAEKRLGTNIEGYQTACTALVSRIGTDIQTITNTL